MNMFFTSDLHFWHRNVIEYCNRPFKSVEEMNEKLIENWAAVIKPDDTVFIVGDMFFCGTRLVKEIMPRLPGKKNLILGNHDWGKLKARRAEEFGFDSITSGVTMDLDGIRIVLNHFPYAGDHTEEVRFLEYRPPDNGDWLIHGHVHNAWRVKGRQINVGVDVWDFKPVSVSEILKIIRP